MSEGLDTEGELPKTRYFFFFSSGLFDSHMAKGNPENPCFTELRKYLMAPLRLSGADGGTRFM